MSDCKDEEKNGEKKGRGRPQVYLTIDRFEKFVGNDFYHLRLQVRYMMMLGFAILGGVIANIFLS